MARVLSKLHGRYIPPIFGLLVCGIILALSRTIFFSALELKTLDWRFKSRPTPQSTDLICHVDIDDASIASLGRFASWPRTRHARALRVLHELGTAAVAFDIEFREPSDTKVDAGHLKNFITYDTKKHFEALSESFVRSVQSLDPKERPDPAKLKETLSRKLHGLLESMHRDFHEQIPHNDRNLQRAIASFGTATYLAGNVSTELDTDPELSARITGALSENFELDALKIARMLDVEIEAVADRLVTLKERLAFDRIWQTLGVGTELDNDAAVLLCMPGFDLSYKSAEREIIERALDRARAADKVLKQVALSKPKDRWNNFPEGIDLNVPLELFASKAGGFGVTNAFPDKADGVLRRVPTYFRWRDRLIPHLSLSFALHALNVKTTDCQPTPNGRTLIIERDNGKEIIRVPLDGNGQLLVNWAGNATTPWTETFSHVSFGSLLELDALRSNIRDNDRYLKLWFVEYMPGQWTVIQKEIEPLEDALWTGEVSESDRTKLHKLHADRAAIEKELVTFLKRNLKPFEGKELEQLDPELREPVGNMRRALRDVPEVQQLREMLSLRADNLKSRLRKLVKGRFCIIGMTAHGSTDIKNTAIDTQLPGVAVHGFVLNSLLTNSFVRRTPGWANCLLTLLMGLTVTTLAGTLSTTRAAAFSVASLIGYIISAYLAFVFFALWVALAAPVSAGFLGYAVVTAYRQLTEERQKREIKHAFQHYLAPSVIEEILKDPTSLQLGGQRREVTVFFSDIAGFTPIAETLDPEELTTLLNEYLTEMSDVILTHEGYLNKYVGDAIMAVFGAPLDQPDHAARACHAALESQTRLVQFREKLLSEKRPPMRARIGINSGAMIVGNMGSDKLFDYTVIGDNVNIGARLENANKAFSTEIIIGEQTRTLVADQFECRRLGLVAVKGRVQPVSAFELLALKGKLPPLLKKLLPHYETGLAAYAEQDFAAAVKAFEQALAIQPNDGPSKAYLKRSRKLLASDAATVWDGSFALEP